VRRVDESKVNVLAGLELEPQWFVEVKSHGTIATLLLVLQPRFVFCGDHARHYRYAMAANVVERYKGGGGTLQHVVTNSVRPMTIVQE